MGSKHLVECPRCHAVYRQECLSSKAHDMSGRVCEDWYCYECGNSYRVFFIAPEAIYCVVKTFPDEGGFPGKEKKK
jgi:hypothetical protein